jgi:hypothetical protein
MYVSCVITLENSPITELTNTSEALVIFIGSREAQNSNLWHYSIRASSGVMQLGLREKVLIFVVVLIAFGDFVGFAFAFGLQFRVEISSKEYNKS